MMRARKRAVLLKETRGATATLPRNAEVYSTASIKSSITCRCRSCYTGRCFEGEAEELNFQKDIAGLDTPMEVLAPRAKRWIKYLIAIVAGNLLYLYLTPYLPPAAQHHPFHLDFGLIIDLWICVAFYGLIEMLLLLVRRIRH